MRKILITGHMGYIGSNLWEYFKYYPHYQINGIDFPIDLSTMTDLPDADYVIHLAASTGVRESIENPQEYFDNNVLGTKSIFNRYGCTNTGGRSYKVFVLPTKNLTNKTIRSKSH